MIYVFTGPTLSASEARALFAGARYLPPVSQGDVYRAALERPWAIGIIDGYFEHVPSVWHKEILWAMSEGIHVLGAASLGALRAAELEAFGMIGVGEIFEAFRAGVLEDDDEVAVAHGAAESGFRLASEAMVNIRSTLLKGEASGVIETDECSLLERLAKSLHYPLRNYPTILEKARDEGMSDERCRELEEWLAVERYDQKREDAVALLKMLEDQFSSRPKPKEVHFTFQATEAWERARRQLGRQPQRALSAGESKELLLDELRLLGPKRYRQTVSLALLRALVSTEAQREIAVSASARQGAVEAFERRHDLRSPDDTESWLAAQELDTEELARLITEEARLDLMRRSSADDVARHLMTELRLEGSFRHLVERVRCKERILRSLLPATPNLEAAGVSASELVTWHFEERLGRPIPPDLEAYARDLDLPGSEALKGVLLTELLYLRSLAERSLEGSEADSEVDSKGSRLS